MIFNAARLPGAFLIEMEPVSDERGFFARSFCRKEFEAHGLDSAVAQCNVSFNALKGTLRGMHLQLPPQEEAKLVRCTAGAMYDVMVDLRRDSPTFLQWQAFELTAQERRMVYVPPGVAHGFQTLADGTEVFYQMSEFFAPDLASGVLWNDPAFGIEWPLPEPILSPRDRSYRPFVSRGTSDGST